MNETSKSNLPAILGVIIAVLLLLNGYLIWDKIQQGKVIKEQDAELTEAEALTKELQANYDDALAQLDAMKTENEELNRIVDEQKDELTKSKEKIDRMIRRGATSQKDLDEAKSQVDMFKVQTQQYLAEIDQLKAENQELTQKTASLSQEKTQLQGNLENQKVKTDSIVKIKASLEEEREVLSEKVKVGSVLRTAFISVQPIKLKENGVEKEVKAAGKTDKLKICFELQENKVVDAGSNEVFLRIINPRGETIAVESQGSGSFKDPISGQAIRYTTSGSVDYNNESTDMCIDWAKSSQEFEAGMYIAEIYNKGYLSGKKEFELK